jgi:hypothetical protein
MPDRFVNRDTTRAPAWRPPPTMGGGSVTGLREWMYRKLRLATNTVLYFLRILRGDFRNLNRAPVGAKKAFAIRRSRAQTAITLSSLPTTSDLREAASRAHDAVGLWPLSFSFPRVMELKGGSNRDFMCPVFPGHKYAFSDEQEYFDMYRNYRFALTHQKAGWDCFRHLEIMYAGSVPFMPDADRIPEFTMVHYPKRMFAEVARHLNQSKGLLPPTARENLQKYFNEHLTSRAMAAYLVETAPSLNQGRVLFIDEAAVSMPDYQSVLTAIGLKQLMGKRVSIGFPLDYLYEDWEGDGRSLYGRGFGYTRALSVSLKNPNEARGQALALSQTDLELFESVVIGNITRNRQLAMELLQVFPPDKTVWIHGEDSGPNAIERDEYRRLGVTVFAREIGQALSF